MATSWPRQGRGAWYSGSASGMYGTSGRLAWVGMGWSSLEHRIVRLGCRLSMFGEDSGVRHPHCGVMRGSSVGEHAVVLGASMGGLLAARVLADFYERVTVVERDALYADAGQRKGVPQGRHFHTVLLRGARVLDGLFPGLTDDLVAAGAPRVNLLRQARVIVNGHQLASADTGSDAIQLTRPMLDGAVRERVAAIPAIKMLDGCDVVGVQANSGRVTGARIVNRTAANPREEVLAADLVVDAMGRSGRAAGWLPELGFTAPKEQRIKVDIAYTSRLLRLRPGALGADRLVLVGAMPGRTRGVALAAQEDDLWMLTAYGVAGDHPPLDEEGLLAFVKSAAPSDVYTAVLHATAETEPRQHKFPASIRRRYERLRAVPAGLLAFGDAICSFNPVYGQGMTVAAVESEVLRACLERGGDDLARRFFPRAAKVIDPVWQLNAGGDLALPEVPGHRPLATRLINRYVARAQRVGASDPDVATAFIRVGGLLDPPAAILAPRILARVIRGGRRRG